VSFLNVTRLSLKGRPTSNPTVNGSDYGMWDRWCKILLMNRWAGTWTLSHPVRPKRDENGAYKGFLYGVRPIVVAASGCLLESLTKSVLKFSIEDTSKQRCSPMMTRWYELIYSHGVMFEQSLVTRLPKGTSPLVTSVPYKGTWFLCSRELP